MSAIDRSIDFSLWSDELRGVVRRRLRECGGVALITLAVMMVVALATWSVQDPSLSNATSTPARNLLGSPGAIAADLLMQLFGLAAVTLVLPVVVWGCRLIAHRGTHFDWRRLALWLIGILLASGFASCLPRTAKWPLPSGLGGITGDAVLRFPAALFGPLNGMTLFTVTLTLGIIAAGSLLIATGIGWRKRAFDGIDEDWVEQAAGPPDDDAENASISLGWLAHAMLSIKSRLIRLFTRRTVRPQPLPGMAAARDRYEPQFDDNSPTLAPGDEEILDDGDAKTSAPSRRVG